MKYKDKVYLARQFRKKLTRLESLLWKQLRNRKLLNLKFRRQHIVLNYVVDFYCSELKLAIEIDGEIHKFQKTRDDERDNLLKQKFGLRILRYKNEDVLNNTKFILDDFIERINKYNPS